MHKGLSEPHIFLVNSNPQVLLRNLQGVLSPAELNKIQVEVVANVVGLFNLGVGHFTFAKSLPSTEWRQKISRHYYGAYNVRRALVLNDSGTFSTDSSDHKEVNKIPAALANVGAHQQMLKTLRDDRNLCDYSHVAKESDLLSPVEAVELGVQQFVNDVKSFLIANGVAI